MEARWIDLRSSSLSGASISIILPSLSSTLHFLNPTLPPPFPDALRNIPLSLTNLIRDSSIQWNKKRKIHPNLIASDWRQNVETSQSPGENSVVHPENLHKADWSVSHLFRIYWRLTEGVRHGSLINVALLSYRALKFNVSLNWSILKRRQAIF